MSISKERTEASDITRPGIRASCHKQPLVGYSPRLEFLHPEEHTRSDTIGQNAMTEILILSELLHLVQSEEGGPEAIIIYVEIVQIRPNIFPHDDWSEGMSRIRIDI